MKNSKYSILFFGDASLCRLGASFSLGEDIKDIFASSNAIIGNLECPITASTTKKPLQTINMSAMPSALHCLNNLSAVSLSNNHIQDFEDVGVVDTMHALQEYHIPYFGIGKTYKEALEPLYFNVKNRKIAIIAATRYANTSSGNWGTAPDDCKELFQKIELLKKECCFVIVFFHWGYEYVRIPSPRERKIAHRCIDLGADFIVGSHPHIYQGVETYRGKKIVYSLGNFIFHSSIFDGLSFIPDDPRLHISYMVGVTFDNSDNYEIELIGYKTTDKDVSLLTDEEQKFLQNNVNDISKNLNSRGRWEYLKEYYSQTANISQQNIKVRKKFQCAKSLSLFRRLLLYRDANSQDVKNRIGGMIIKVLQWTGMLKRY